MGDSYSGTRVLSLYMVPSLAAGAELVPMLKVTDEGRGVLP